MGEGRNLLVTVFYESQRQLIKCALGITKEQAWKIEGRHLESNEVKGLVNSFLPLHVKSCGPVVHVEDIFEIHLG